MPWKESTTMDLRVRLIQDYNEGHSISALAEIHEVSRKTIYKWLGRHEEAGAAGLADRSRTPLHSPGKLSDELIARIIEARHRWHWDRASCASNSPRRILTSRGPLNLP